MPEWVKQFWPKAHLTHRLFILGGQANSANMGDGTPAMGKRHKKTHGLCLRCGKRSFHYQKKTCASCGYPATKMRSYDWAPKADPLSTFGAPILPSRAPIQAPILSYPALLSNCPGRFLDL